MPYHFSVAPYHFPSGTEYFVMCTTLHNEYPIGGSFDTEALAQAWIDEYNYIPF